MMVLTLNLTFMTFKVHWHGKKNNCGRTEQVDRSYQTVDQTPQYPLKSEAKQGLQAIVEVLISFNYMGFLRPCTSPSKALVLQGKKPDG